MILKGHVITNCWLPEDSQQRTIIPDEVHLAGKFQPDALEKKKRFHTHSMAPMMIHPVFWAPYFWRNPCWLVVLTILKNISQWEGLSHVLWKIKNV